MKISFWKRRGGFTLIEILVVLATLAALIILLLPALSKAKSRSNRIYCVSHLKQIGLGFRIWSGQHKDNYPTQISTNVGGTMEFVETTNTFLHFQILSNELGTAFILTCPNDKQRKTVHNFPNLRNENLSYFVGPDANENLPQSILAGDRNITNGFAPKNGMLELTTNQSVGWTETIHKFQGNVALGDGSVQQVTSARLRSEIIPNTGFATNRILLP